MKKHLHLKSEIINPIEIITEVEEDKTLDKNVNESNSNKWENEVKEYNNKKNWKEDIYPFKNFTEELTQKWVSRGFTKKETREWLDNGLQPTDASFARWLQSIKRKDAKWFLDEVDEEGLRKEFKEYLEKESISSRKNWSNEEEKNKKEELKKYTSSSSYRGKGGVLNSGTDKKFWERGVEQTINEVNKGFEIHKENFFCFAALNELCNQEKEQELFQQRKEIKDKENSRNVELLFGKWNSRGITPITVKVASSKSDLAASCRPMMFGSPPNSVCQRR